MERSIAQNHVKETFQNPFDKDRFVYFIKNLLNKIDESKAFRARGYIKEKFKRVISVVKTYERVGTYTDPEGKKIDVLVVYLEKDNSIDRARTTLRNFVADYLKQRGGKDAGLVAFVSPNHDDWRFSLVKMEYKITETPSEKVKAEEKFTPAKRYSFLVGRNETSHTAQSCLMPILEDDAHDPTLKQLEDTFNIEKVTKEFFAQYRGLYLNLKEYLDKLIEDEPSQKIKKEFKAEGIDTAVFCKKLLGQIVFLYFLQKKGWLGAKEKWGDGDKRFLRNLFIECKKKQKNFFNDYLEYLFYDALNNENRGGVDPSIYPKFNCKIPFLNGGLFNEDYDWERTDIKIENELFSNKKGENAEGDGILDIFDLYNFTVKEDEPLEKEVAIDPEMLGKVFENLLEVRDRKSKGTYYTPREIVHYMCRESLVNYLYSELNPGSASHAEIEQKKLFGGSDPKQLKLLGSRKELIPREDVETLIKYGETVVEHENRVVNAGRETSTYSFKLPESIRKNAKSIDERLVSIRVCDPAVGSGAFIVGMMSEIIRTRNALTPYLASRHSDPPEAGKESRTIYDFKRHAIQNCLYGVDIDPGAVEIAKLRLWLSLVVDEEDIKQIKPLPNLDYKIVCGNSLLGVEKDLFNDQLFSELERLKPFYFNEIHPPKKQEYKKQIDQLISKITKGHREFDFEVYFSEVFHEKKGFDVVIANPPYGAEYPEQYKKLFRNHYKSAQTIPGQQKGSLDTFVLFIEKGFNFLRKHGSLNYIVPISITSSDSVVGLHQLLEKNCRIIKISSYAVRPQPVFESAAVNTSIVFLVKTQTPCENILCTKMYRKGKNFNLEYLINNLQFIDVKKYKLNGRYPKISLPIEAQILDKLLSIKTKIADLFRKDGRPIYYRTTGGRYFKIITNYPTSSTKEKPLYFDEKISNSIGAILSSNLFFWYYQIYSNNLDLKSYEIESFPIPIERLTADNIRILERLYVDYLKDVEEHVTIRKSENYARIDSFKEYKIGKSKKYIDAIDDFISPLYGLTKEKVEFLKNYEIEFRLTDEGQ